MDDSLGTIEEELEQLELSSTGEQKSKSPIKKQNKAQVRNVARAWV